MTGSAGPAASAGQRAAPVCGGPRFTGGVETDCDRRTPLFGAEKGPWLPGRRRYDVR